LVKLGSFKFRRAKMKNNLPLSEAEFQQPEHAGSVLLLNDKLRWRASRDRLLAWAVPAVMSISGPFL